MFAGNNYVILFISLAILSVVFFLKLQRRRKIMLLITFSCIFMIFAAYCQPVLSFTKKARKAVGLIDVSASITDHGLDSANELVSSELKKEYYDQLEYIVFAEKPLHVGSNDVNTGRLPDMRKRKSGIFSNVSDTYFHQSNIRDAVLYAVSILEGKGDIYLYTDGVETQNIINFHELARVYPGISVHTELASPDKKPRISLENVFLPASISVGQNITARLVVDSNIECNVTVLVKNNDNPVVIDGELLIAEGRNIINIPVSVSNKNVNLEFELQGKECDILNDRIYKSINACDMPKVSVLVEEDAVYENIQQVLGGYLELSRLNEVSDLLSADLLVVQDMGIDNNISEFIEVIQQRLLEGMGLLILPSPNFFNDKVINNKDMKEMLPVDIYQKNQNAVSTNAIVFVIDTSKSMEGDRLLIAKEIIRNTIANLSERDLAGIVEFYGNRRWAAPMQSAANTLEINRAINRLTYGGSTILYPALQEAYYGLLNVNSSTRHIVVITDGNIEKIDLSRDINLITKDKITLSTICVNNSVNASKMYNISNLGKGVFFHSRDRFSMPVLNFNSVYSNIGDAAGIDSVNLLPGLPHRVMSNVDFAGLSLSKNYYFSKSKQDSQNILYDNNGNPVLSIRHYGLGQVVFCTGNTLFYNNDSTSILFQNLCKQLVRKNKTDTLEYAQVGDKLNIKYRLEAGVECCIQKPKARLIMDNKVIAEQQMYCSSTGNISLHAEFDDLESGFYSVAIADSSGRVLDSAQCSYNLINEKNRMPWNDNMPEIGSVNEVDITESINIWQFFVLISLSIFLFGIYFRRKNVEFLNAVIFIVLTLSLAGNTIAGEVNDKGRDLDRSDLNPAQSKNYLLSSILNGDYSAATKDLYYKDIDDDHLKCLSAIAHYQCGDFTRSTDMFSEILTGDLEYYFGRMVLAWGLLSADKNGQHMGNIIKAVAEPEKDSGKYSDMIAVSYILNKEYREFINIYNRQRNKQESDISNNKFWDQQLISAYSISDNDMHDEVGKLFADIKLSILFQARLKIMAGRRNEAGQMLSDYIDTNIDTDNLISLAYFSLRYSLFSTAEKAAKKMMEIDQGIGFQAAILYAESLIAQNKKTELFEILEYLLESETLPYSLQSEIAQIYEKVGEPEKAIDLLKQAYNKSSDIKYYVSVAMLYEKFNNLDKAYQAWQEIWKLTKNSDGVSAETKLLDLARKTGKLPELTVDLEYEYEQTKDVDTFYLLMSIYLSIQDSVSVTDLIDQYYGSDTVESLQIKHQAYLITQDYNLCEQMLMQLLEKDKDNYDMYLRKLGVLASLRGESGVINFVRNELKEISINNLIKVYQQSCAAGLIGDHERAMQLLQPMLDKYPDNGELLLSWVNASIAAGKQAEALSRVKEVIHGNPDIVLLSYAVDSILNMDIAEEELYDTLYVVYEYITHSPENTMLYYLALDIIDSMKQYELISNVVLTAMVYAPDRSYQLIRHALRYADIPEDLRIDLSRILLITNCKLSSQDYFGICMTLLNNGMYYEAEYVLKCYLSDTYNPQEYMDVAEYYRNEGMTDRCRLILQEALTYSPDNNDLLLMQAYTYVSEGQYQEAFKLFRLIYQNYAVSISGETQTSNYAEMNKLRQTVLNGMMYSASDIDRQVVSLIEDEIMMCCEYCSDQNVYTRMMQFILDMTYVCRQTSRYEYLLKLADKIRVVNFDCYDKLQSFFDKIFEDLEPAGFNIASDDFNIDTEFSKLSYYSVNNDILKLYLSNCAVMQSNNSVFNSAKVFLENLQINKNVDKKIIRQFYYSIWSRLSDEQHLAFYDVVAGVSYEHNHYVILIKLDSGVLGQYPDDCILSSINITSDPAISTIEILSKSAMTSYENIINRFLQSLGDKAALQFLKLIIYLGANIDDDISVLLEQKIKTYSFSNENAENTFNDYINFFSSAVINKNLSLLLITKLIDEYPTEPAYQVIKLKCFQYSYDRDKYIIDVIASIENIINNSIINVNSSRMLETLVLVLSPKELLVIADNIQWENCKNIAACDYLRSLIYYYQGDYINAKVYAGYAYIKEPNCLVYRKNVASIYESTGDYQELADIFRANLEPKAGITPIVYHNLVGYYSLAGKSDLAVQMAKNVPDKLRKMDYLTVYYLMSNNEFMLQYFRDSFSTNSTSSYACKWPEMFTFGGITSRQLDNTVIMPFEHKLVYKIAQNKPVFRELQRFWMTVIDDNNTNILTYAQAYARYLYDPELLNKIEDDLSYRYKKQLLSLIDNYLIFSLFYHKHLTNNRHCDMVENSFGVLLTAFDDGLMLISKAYYNNADYEKAIRYAQMQFASNVFSYGKNLYRINYHEILYYLCELHEKELDGIHVSLNLLNCFLRQNPDESSALAAKLKLLMLCGNDDEADKLVMYIIDNIINTISKDHMLIEETLRYCARKGKMDIFKNIVSDCIGRTNQDDDYFYYDYILADVDPDDIKDFSDIVFEKINLQLDNEVMRASIAIRNYSLLAISVYDKSPETSKVYLNKANSLSNYDSINDLWLADAYYYCGDSETSKIIEKRLDSLGRLPYTRIMRSSEGVDRRGR